MTTDHRNVSGYGNRFHMKAFYATRQLTFIMKVFCMRKACERNTVETEMKSHREYYSGMSKWTQIKSIINILHDRLQMFVLLTNRKNKRLVRK